MSQKIFADIHCHPSFKPYGQSFTKGNERPNPQPGDVISLWHEGKASKIEAAFSKEFGVAMYTQSHLAAAAAAGMQVICISVGALEREFITFKSKLPTIVEQILINVTGSKVDLQDFLCNLVSRFGKARLDKVRNSDTYWPDLMSEIAYVKAQQNAAFQMPHDQLFYTFRIVADHAEIAQHLSANESAEAGLSASHPIVISLVMTMEGLHNLDAGFDKSEDSVVAHAKALKNMPDTPFFFVTFCHHFWNGLCGHAQSLGAPMNLAFIQKDHMNEGFKPIGFKVLKTLLDKSEGRRILIDIKHLSYIARNQYFKLLRGFIPDDAGISPELKQELSGFFRFSKNDTPPILASHAAVNGYSDFGNHVYEGNYPGVMNGVMSPFENRSNDYDPSINFFDSDLIEIANFKGLAGIQLDIHRIAGKTGLTIAATQRYPHAWLVWNQVLHMVELWDRLNFANAWDIPCIGSDFDGIIDPMQNMETYASFPELREGLNYYANLYFLPTDLFMHECPGMGERGSVANRHQQSARNANGQRLNSQGLNAPEKIGLTPEAIVDKICSGNVLEFMKKHFVM